MLFIPDCCNLFYALVSVTVSPGDSLEARSAYLDQPSPTVKVQKRVRSQLCVCVCVCVRLSDLSGHLVYVHPPPDPKHKKRCILGQMQFSQRSERSHRRRQMWRDS